MAMNIFKEIAKKETTLSYLMSGREKIDTDEIIANYPDGITVTEFEVIQVGEDMYPVVTFSEDNTKFYNGGSVLMKICSGWLEHFSGDNESANIALAKTGGVKCKLSKSKTKSGNNITVIDII